ncbi:hypothetical protein HN51_060850 [Arachis hypogaea]|uniref:Olee1-like protein n=1 Tax=Arachis hypogaea TaxID=3818 RepID=A0A444XB47_ARAHY|nr:olee1-like protein [Arachis ipaensis]XP_025640273.1 olee1-like protein [Arachis hypogaea]QHO04464.1 Olee1-like protein [Arachis hypogaea]RYQ86924.1 hypothetical protein Ahy_B10g106528 [Arachis hypogaea]
MAKSTIMVIAALCLMSVVGSAYGYDKFFVEGKVYCDTCRIQFLTSVSEFLPGATVRLECKVAANETITYVKDVTTDAAGKYSIEVEGDHEEELCEVFLIDSPRQDCNEIKSEVANLETASRVSLTHKNGIVSAVREANPLGFLKAVPLAECPQIFKELGLNANGTASDS